MKLWQCDWVPSSVADWLSKELDQKGIPGTTYTYTLFSLLHPYFCPHPVPKTSTNSTTCLIKTESLKSVLKSLQTRGFVGLLEEFEDYVHPDADFPDLNITDHIKEGGTRRSKKRQKKKLQELVFTPEKLWKITAIQCLLTASDEYDSLKLLIEELFCKLKATHTSGFTEELESSESLCIRGTTEENVTEESSLPRCLDFPLAAQLTELQRESIDLKSLLLNDKVKGGKNISTVNFENENCSEVKHNLNSVLEEKGSTNYKLAMEIGREKFAESELLESKASCFVPILADTLSLFSSEKSHLDSLFSSNPKKDMASPEAGLNEKLEEWECMGDVVTSSDNEKSAASILAGSRLFERSFLPSTMHREDEDGEFTVDASTSDSDSVWGCKADSLNVSLGQWKSHHPDHGNVSSLLPMNPEDAFENTEQLVIDHLQDLNQKGWKPLASRESGNDPVFSGAFRFSPCRDGTKRDSICSLLDISGDIWTGSNNTSLADNMSGDHKERVSVTNDTTTLDREKLCESFKHLGLEHLWRDSDVPDGLIPGNNVLSGGLCDNVFAENFNASIESKIDQSLSPDLFNMTLKNDISEDNLSSVPIGPSGPYVELKHTESSGFSTVVPHKTEAEGNDDDSLSLEKDLIVASEGSEMTLDRSVASEEENLLTSPRTHFRPIRQITKGNMLEDGKTDVATVKSEDDVVFQRTDSGTLFLENDLVEGSPKKYMVYLEPSSKLACTQETLKPQSAEVKMPSDATTSSFVPKFKIINNEKFCQTEQDEEEYLANLGHDSNEKLVSEFIKSESPKKSPNSEWNSNYHDYIKDLWENEPKMPNKQVWENKPNMSNRWGNEPKIPSRDAWESEPKMPSREVWELDLPSPKLTGEKWSENDVDRTRWSPGHDSHLDIPSIFPTVSKKSSAASSLFKDSDSEMKDSDSFQKLKSIWQDETENYSRVATGSSAPSQFDFKLPEKYHLNSSWIDPLGDGYSDNAFKIGENPWSVAMDLPATKSPIKRSKSKREENPERPVLWQLQWEVDQEADEILGHLPTSPLRVTPSFLSLKDTEQDDIDAEDSHFLNYLNAQEPIEDLEIFAPGWDLNEGFEWGAPTEEGLNDDEREILVYETEDGQTVMVPVEYLDDSLYDEIFGSDVNTPLGGSLPDLPNEQVDWKKFARRNKEGRCVPPSQRPCSFFLEGNCRRSDCKFSHDLLTITCRFWEEGSCFKGETCNFRHGFMPPRRRNRSEGDEKAVLKNGSVKEGGHVMKGRPIPKRRGGGGGSGSSLTSYELDSETDFPCLGSSVESKNSSFEEPNFPQNITVKLSKKKKKYVTVPRSVLKEAGIDLKGNSAVNKAQRLKKMKKAKGGKSSASENFAKKEAIGGGKDEVDSKRKECISLRKLLRKRANAMPIQLQHSHEDGTVSDY